MKQLRALLTAAALFTMAACARMPADDSVEAGFARDMAAHHEQAAEMGFIIRDASRDAALRTLAYDIIVTQSAQRGMFMAWLQQWGLPQASSTPRMAWMHTSPTTEAASHDMAGHSMPGMPLMMGMASGEELDALRRATGRDAEVLFLQLMIRHHESGVLMAKSLLTQSHREDVLSVVRGIDGSQTAEIAMMSAMLAERHASPYPSLLQ